MIRHPFEIDRLGGWLGSNVSGFGGKLEVTEFSGGQSNPTYLITSGSQRCVMRRKPPGALLPSAHAVDREYRVMAALANSDVPVPRVHVYCDDPSIVGTPFYVMDFVEGRTFWDPTLPGIKAAERAALYNEMNRVIAALHSVDYEAAGLQTFGRPGNYLARQIDRWTRQYRASETEPVDAMERLIEWLQANVPADDETTLVHGDYRIDNLVFHPSEARIVAVLDWELSTLGHPLADFAYHCMSWRVTPDEFRGMKGHDLAALGIPSERDYVASYCARTGRGELRDWDYYVAFNMFRMAAILQGILARSLQGSAVSAEARETGMRARPMAEAGWRQVVAAQEVGGSP